MKSAALAAILFELVNVFVYSRRVSACAKVRQATHGEFRLVWLLFLLGALCGNAQTLAVPGAQQYSFTGRKQTYAVPSDAKYIRIDACGGTGGQGVFTTPMPYP